MSLSLRTRLVAGQVVVVLVALSLVTLLTAQRQRQWVAGRTAASLEQAGRQVATGLPRDDDYGALAARLGRTLGYRVTFVDSAGRVLGDSDVPAGRLARVENHAARPEVAAALHGHVGRSLRHSHTIGVDLVYVAVPGAAGGRVAAVRLAEPLVAVRALDASLLRLTLISGALALLLSVPLVFWVAARQARRVRQLEAVARRLGTGDRTARALEQPADELGRLGRALNDMAAEAQIRLAALERERDERERILAHLSDGVALVDGAGRIVRMNRRFAELIGAPLPAEEGMPLPEFVRSSELDRLVQSAGEGERTQEADLRLWTGDQRLLHATATSLGTSDDRPVLLVLHDLSEAERLDRVRRDFVANVSHELRTPLTSLRGYAETLLDGGLEDPENRERFVRVIRDQAVRLEAIAQDLLTLADLERSGARLHPEGFDLREVLARQAATFQARAARARIELAVEPGPPLPMTADLRLVEQMLANLLDNALKYTERGSVRVRAGESGRRIWCEVEDTGCGIPATDQPRVFERFYRVDKARSRQQGGTGLGLAIVKHIAGLHGGEVTLRSRVGEGSCFRVEMPREAARPSGAAS
ncbi:MAG TPA: ATP-binding protein [Thermoanaerobaculaceae bacterium]|nr:ATP-binding protein [Thermoanaerobaculaceae bacterium]